MDKNSVESIIAAVEHGYDRISHISITDISGPALETLATAMQQSLPTLQVFDLMSCDKSVPVLPETFLGGSAPILQTFALDGIPFPTFPKFILSSTHIRTLFMLDIPEFGYISPNAMAACLAALLNLEDLSIGFRSPLSRPPQITQPPHTRIVLPALTQLSFCGASEYLEDFVARIDTPFLNRLNLAFFMDLIFEIPRLRHFISRAGRLKPFDQLEARMEFYYGKIQMSVGSFELQIRCERPDRQLSSVVQIFGQQLPLLSHVEKIEIFQSPSVDIEWIDNPDMDSSLWTELFHLFIAVQSLRISEKLAPPIAAALHELTGERIMEVLPVLHSLSLEAHGASASVPEGIRSFVTSRQQSNHPVAMYLGIVMPSVVVPP